MAGMNQTDLAHGYVQQVFGAAQQFTVAAAATVRNASALTPGRYLIHIAGAAVRLRSGGATVTAVNTDQILGIGERAFFTAGGDHLYLSIYGVGAGAATVTICGSEEATAGTLPTWS